MKSKTSLGAQGFWSACSAIATNQVETEGLLNMNVHLISPQAEF